MMRRLLLGLVLLAAWNPDPARAQTLPTLLETGGKACGAQRWKECIGLMHAVGRLGTLLGTDIDPLLADVTVELEMGDVLVLYTDGLTEAQLRYLPGQALQTMTYAAMHLGDTVRTRSFGTRAIAEFRKLGITAGLGELLRIVSETAMHEGRFAEAARWASEAVTLARQQNDSTALITALASQATILAFAGRTSQAEAAVDEAGVLARRAGPNEKAMAAYGRGFLHGRLGDHAAALSAYSEAASFPVDRSAAIVTAKALAEKGDTLGILRRDAEAMEAFDALDRLMKTNGRDFPGGERLRLYTAAGMFLNSIGFERARTLVAKHREKRLQSMLGASLLTTGSPFHSGVIALGMERWEEAVKQFRQAAGNPGTMHGDIQYVIQTGIGLALERQGDLEGAADAQRHAIEQVERLRDRLPADARTRFFAGSLAGISRMRPYEALTRVYVGLGRASDAFEIAETARARALLEHAASLRRDGAEQPPAGVAVEEQRIETRLRELLLELRNLTPETRDRAGDLEADLAGVRRERSALITRLRREAPRYAALMYPEAVAAADVTLEDDEVLLSFEVTATRTFVFRLSKGALQVFAIDATRDALTERVRTLRSAFDGVTSRRDLKRYDRRLAKQLGKQLFGAALRGVPAGRRVILVPDESLALLPFGALPVGGRPLAEKYVLTYAPSASALTQHRALITRGGEARGVLVVADPIFGPSDPRASGHAMTGDERLLTSIRRWRTMGVAGVRTRRDAPTASRPETPAPNDLFPRLGQTAKLASEIRTEFGDEARLLVGLDAGEASVVAAGLQRYRHLVFATHGILDGAVPRIQQPALVLGQVGLRSGSDGFLTEREVLGLRLDADLVALTACQTGMGHQAAGEGVMSMGRAFLHAGARNVLMTLWSVAEDASTVLTADFMRRLAAGEAPDEALKAAQAHVRRKGWKHPFFWSGFVLMGGVRGTPRVAEATTPSKRCDPSRPTDCTRLGLQYLEGKGVALNPGRALELLTEACRLGDGRGCFEAARMHARAKGVVQDSKKAFPLYQQGCTLGFQDACNLEANYWMHGYAGPKDEARAVRAYRWLCDADHAEACDTLGWAYLMGKGVGEDMQRAAELRERACTLGFAGGCSGLGWLLTFSGKVPKDEARGLALFDRACKGGSGVGCNNLGSLLVQGSETVRDIPRAAEAFRRACELHWANGCINWARFLRKGHGVEADPAKAVRVLREACDRKPFGQLLEGVCEKLAEALDQGWAGAPDANGATEAYATACAGGEETSCVLHAQRRIAGKGIRADPAGGARAMVELCEGGSGYSCNTVAVDYHKGRITGQPEPGKAIPLYRKGCDLNFGRACANLGILYEDGDGVDKDPQAAVRLWQQGCALGYYTACGYVGDAYRTGYGVEPDPVQAESLLTLACEKGGEWSCWKLGITKDADGQAAAQPHYVRACKAGQTQACATLGERLWSGADGWTKQPADALKYLELGCNRGDIDACANLSAHYLNPGPHRNSNLATTFATRACNAGEPVGCHNVGVLQHAVGQTARALELFERACSAKPPVSKSCHNLGVMKLESGRRTEGCAALSKACKLGQMESCMAHQLGCAR